MPTATITSKGQITIPAEIRKKLRLKTGDKVDFYESAEGKIIFHPKTGSIMDMKGILKRLGYVQTGPAPTVEELDQSIADHVAELDFQTLSDEGKKQYLKSNPKRKTA
jgi:antitoxin PrlF